MLTRWPIMQKVRSRFIFITWAAYKTTNLLFFPHGTCAIAYVLYLVFGEGSPLNSNSFITILLIKQTDLFSFLLIIESPLISFPKATKIFQFASFIT